MDDENEDEITVEDNGQVKDYESPLCPVCGDAMVRTHIECDDKSGWMHGWTCTCDDGYGWQPGEDEEQTDGLPGEEEANALALSWNLYIMLDDLKKRGYGRLRPPRPRSCTLGLVTP